MKPAPAFSIVILFCIASFAQTTPPAQADSTSQDLIAKSQSLMQAEKSKDVQALKNAIADDFRMVSSDGKESGRGELLGGAEEGVLRDFMFYAPQVTSIDSDSALVTYNLIVTMLEGDDQIAPRYQGYDLWCDRVASGGSSSSRPRLCARSISK
jgi:hypothetical protein